MAVSEAEGVCVVAGEQKLRAGSTTGVGVVFWLGSVVRASRDMDRRGILAADGAVPNAWMEAWHKEFMLKAAAVVTRAAAAAAKMG